jgi:hypothetical protein
MTVISRFPHASEGPRALLPCALFVPAKQGIVSPSRLQRCFFIALLARAGDHGPELDECLETASVSHPVGMFGRRPEQRHGRTLLRFHNPRSGRRAKTISHAVLSQVDPRVLKRARHTRRSTVRSVARAPPSASAESARTTVDGAMGRARHWWRTALVIAAISGFDSHCDIQIWGVRSSREPSVYLVSAARAKRRPRLRSRRHRGDAKPHQIRRNEPLLVELRPAPVLVSREWRRASALHRRRRVQIL